MPLVKAPGTTIEVSMPKRASSYDIVTASESIAALAAAYGPMKGGKPPRTVVLLTHSTSPDCWPRIAGSTALLTRCVPSTLVSNTLTISSGVKASVGPTTRWPALWTTTSSRPCSPTMVVDRLVGRGLRQHVELDRADVVAVCEAPVAQFAHARRVAAGDVAHAGVDDVALRPRARGP